MFEQPLKFLVVFFVVVEPMSLIPLFSGLTTGATAQYQRRMALKRGRRRGGHPGAVRAWAGRASSSSWESACRRFASSAACCCFCCHLRWCSRASPAPALPRIEAAESKRRADISVFPLAFPFIAGPGALATILLWFGPVHLQANAALFAAYLVAVLIVLAIAFVLMVLSEPLMRVIGVTGANVSSRLLGVILGALAVQFVLDGLRQAFGVG